MQTQVKIQTLIKVQTHVVVQTRIRVSYAYLLQGTDSSEVADSGQIRDPS